MIDPSDQPAPGVAQTCPVCLNDMADLTRNVAITVCGHAFCFQCMVNMVYTQAGAKCPCCRQNIDIKPSPELTLTRVAVPRRVLPASLASAPPTVYEPQIKVVGTHEWLVSKFSSDTEPRPQSIWPEDLLLAAGNRNVFEFAKLLDVLPYPNRLRISVRELFVEFRRWLLSVPHHSAVRDRHGMTMSQFEAHLLMLGFSAMTTRGINLELKRRVKGYNLFIEGSVEVVELV